ncbi:ABC transporter substrate-binding protein [Neobacillus sp. D3-1R]|uniref:ABC transporter substrate-binding protein n=1 Tax=Neobacillus sp. D3-1R TaxID=3445778 RepID=UPI003F9EDD52
MKHQLIDDFVKLRNYYSLEEQSHSVTMDEISGILFCTSRNAKLILKKMIEQNWIAFISGRGRGNKSKLEFLITVDEVVLSVGKRYIGDGDITEGLQLISQYGSINAKKEITSWIHHFFGYERQGSSNEFIDIIRLPIFRTINTLIPRKAYFDFDAHLIKQIYNTLVLYKHDSDTVTESLAHHWECNREMTTWNFYLRKGVLFHHGKELDAFDVQFTVNELIHKDHKQSWLVENIQAIKIMDKYTLQFQLKKKCPLFLRYLCFPTFSIIPADITDYHELNLPPGTGPYMVKKYHPNACRLEVFPSYFEGRAHIDRIEISNMPKDYSDLLESEVIFVNTGESKYESNPSWNQSVGSYAGSTLFTFNLNKINSPQNNRYFREAIEKIIDREKMIKELGEPRIYPSSGFEIDFSRLHYKKENASSSEIIGLLEKADYQHEEIFLYTYDRHEPDALWIKEQFQKYHIQLRVVIVGWQEILDPDFMQQADCILFEAVWGEDELSKLEQYLSDYSFIKQHWPIEKLPYLNTKINEILAEESKKVREQTFNEITHTILNERLAVFLVHKTIESSFHPSIQGIQFNGRGHIDFKKIWKKQESL